MRANRRSFLGWSAAALSGLSANRCAPSEDEIASPTPLDEELVGALAKAVLPVSALGPDGIEHVVAGFRSWVDGFEPVAELDHPYYHHEILYGPPDPAPRWQASLEALDLEARRRFGGSFVSLSEEERRTVVRIQIRNEVGPRPIRPAAEAQHVAVGLLAYFYATSKANDLCYQAAIEKWTCRGLDTAANEPGW